MAHDGGVRRPTFSTGTRLFVIIVAASNIAAFWAYWAQADGLVGPTGILPAGDFLSGALQQIGRKAWFEVPSLCWIFGTGTAIKAICAAGIALSAAVILGYAQAIGLFLIWVCYLSLVSVGQDFFNFQWDALLLESTLVAIFVVPWTLGKGRADYDPPPLARYLVWWLLFRLMFLSGIVKLTSGDPAWRHLTALDFHYETQPLPTAIAWYASKLPQWFQVASCALMFAVELGAPFCVLAPRRIRHWAAVAMIGLQIAIAATGNYAFFNLLSIGLCLACLDDGWWSKIHWGVADAPTEGAGRIGRLQKNALRWFAALSLGLTFFESAVSVAAGMLPGIGSSPVVEEIFDDVAPLRSFNTYGLFAVMTVERPELVFEGSDDGQTWKEYTLPFKPGDPARRPRWAAPYQPRLDWQLWFAAFLKQQYDPFVRTVCEKLLLGDKPVLALFSSNPFPEHPPSMVRVVRYRYQFTSAAERARTHCWWDRSPLDFYVPPVKLTGAAP